MLLWLKDLIPCNQKKKNSLIEMLITSVMKQQILVTLNIPPINQNSINFNSGTPKLCK